MTNRQFFLFCKKAYLTDLLYQSLMHSPLVMQSPPHAKKPCIGSSLDLSIPVIRINVNGSLEKFQWVSYCKYDTKSKEITIKLHDHLKPYLLELNKLYSQIPLKITSNFKSYYTLRLYQLLKCEYGEKRKTAFTFNLDEIREFFQIEDSKYRNTKDLIRYTIKSAVDELNESDFCIITNYEEIRARTRGTPLKGVKFSAILCDSKKEKDNKILELKTKAAIESIMKSKEE